MQVILTPPVAFILYFALVAILFGVGRLLAGKGHPSEEKSSIYASGEASPLARSLPGYRGFFVIALFFAVLHLGVLMLGSSGAVSPISIVYLIGLMLALIVLIIG
jgi:NADH:ubiquinone oxidoreductase subunit 3 (subunit A)